MSEDAARARKRETIILSILAAMGVIVLLAAAEYAIPRWLHPGPGESGSFFTSNAPNSAPTIKPGDPGPDENGRSSSSQPFECPHGDSHCLDPKPRASDRKPSANSAGKRAGAQQPPDPQAGVGSPQQGGTQSPPPGADTGAEENLRATEEATAHLVELEREELDRLSARTRAMNDRVEAAIRQQTASGSLREDLAFSQQRLQNDLNQANAGLKSADVQRAKIYLDLARGELDKLAKLLARQ